MAIQGPISLAALQAVFERAPLGIALYGRDLRYIDVNDTFARFNDLERDAHRGRALAEVLPDLATVITGALSRVFADGAAILDFPMIGSRSRADAGMRHWLASYLPVEEGGQVAAAVALVREVTSDRRTQLLLHAQKHILEHLVRGDALSDVLTMIVDTLCGCSVDGFIPTITLVDRDGSTLRHGAGPATLADYSRAIDGQVIGPAAGSCGTAVFRRRRVIVEDIQTDPLWAEYRGLASRFGLRACWSTPIIATSGRVLGSFALYYHEPRRPSADDLTLIDLMARTTALVIELRRGEEERRRLLDAERAARRDAESANRGKDEFVATLSHELRTPLNAILGWVSMLKSGTFRPGAENKALDAIERNVHTQARLVEDLIDLSRIIAGKLRIERRAIAIGAVADAALDAVRPAAEAKAIELVTAPPSAADSIVDGDQDRLKQVLWNLLANAIKFTPAGGRVDLRIERGRSEVDVTVSDTGCGMPPELVPHVFDRFRQGERQAGATGGGLGLGLAIARHIVELHGGTIDAASDGVARGSTFRVRLPLAAHQAQV
jgi:signal transduction histidine kinase